MITSLHYEDDDEEEDVSENITVAFFMFLRLYEICRRLP